MGGEIGIENNLPEAGTSFWFTAGLDKRRAGALDVWSPPDALNAVPVLVLHPSSLMRDVLVAQAVACGVRVRAEDDAAKGLKELRAAAYGGSPYKAILIDSRLDRLEVFDLVQVIKKDSDLPTPGIVMLTSVGESPDSILSTLPEPRTQLLKPIKQSRLADALLWVLGKHEPARPGSLDTAATRVASERVTPHLRHVENLHPDEPRIEPRILLVEDDAATQDAIGQLLRQMGFAVDPAANGVAAVDAACERRYDAILMDCQMPELDGARAAAEIRRCQRGARRTPIIGLTASAAESVDDSLVRGEFDDYLCKPARAEEIRAKLDKWCRAGEVPHESGSDLASTLSDPVVVNSLRRTFLKDARARLRVLRRAVDGGDFQIVAQTAHALYGGCLMVGASDLAQACQSLESLSRRGSGAPLAEALGTVESEFGRFHELITNATGSDNGAKLAPLTKIKEKPLSSP
jgi:CheY-like chemotaxis protein/HPt (histidine-containing phosphotransfer) domain-containing protein